MVVEKTLFYLLTGMRGGTNRVRILRSLLEQPKNANQLATDLNLNYKTVRHHLGLLTDHGIVTSTGSQYAEMYFTTDAFSEHREVFERISSDIDSSSPENKEKPT
ncbi:winged helix-turn-helix domain-containing protein [Halalkalicoccus tibetensis]|uniref:ArsR/SmtB family transcription factor n=1 Tax=Halalkalicoccus tibetensis TaxID=175632 RepID=A0ABD5V6P3_9EURY